MQNAPQWEPVEIVLTSRKTWENAYTDVTVYAEFTGPSGVLRRPAFWAGGNVWKVRFSSPVDSGTWTYRTVCSHEDDAGLHDRTGSLTATPASASRPLLAHGLLRMTANNRAVMHADGTPFFVVGDTPWSLPWRATVEDVRYYAMKRQAQGYNAALLMTLQPDREAEGPDARNTVLGFARAFDDLPQGRLTGIRPEYFDTFDVMVTLLLDHGIVPVYQPVFHGYGWKGKNVWGWHAHVEDYVRYCRYLVARFGASPAFWLVGADGFGSNAGVREAGAEIEAWDCYCQPTGIHYSPFDTVTGPGNNPLIGFHGNRAWQFEPWLDFQWCQTGHSNVHDFTKVSLMFNNLPVKACANGEPTYEGIGRSEHGAGFWQGIDAWGQLTAGGTMGVFYGAPALWKWKITIDEPGWEPWCSCDRTWKTSLDLPGAVFPGLVGRAMAGIPLDTLRPDPARAFGAACLTGKDNGAIVWLPVGECVLLTGLDVSQKARWFDPQTGQWSDGPAITMACQKFIPPSPQPWVLFIG